MLGCNKIVLFVSVKHNMLVILDEGFMSLLYSAFTYAITGRVESVIPDLYPGFGTVTHSNFKVYQMNVKSAFLNGELEEEVYMEHLKVP